MGILDRAGLFSRGPKRRPRGGTAYRDAFIPPDPTPAQGAPPPSPAEAFTTAGVLPPRPLVWVGTAASGAAIWSSPVANGAGQKLCAELRAVAAATRTWPVLTGAAPVPTSWSLSQSMSPADVTVPDAGPLLADALSAAPTPELGWRTRLEPTQDTPIEADLAAGYLSLVCDVEAWQVPLAVGFDGIGGWSASEHAAVLRQWSHRYQAQLVALTDASVGVWVGRPPRSHEAAMAAAEEIYAYCPDVVTHGVGTLWALATTLAVSDAWSLRWTR